MWRSLLFVCAVVACFAPTTPEGAPCAAGGICPTGLTCQGGVCTSGTIDGAVATDSLVIDSTDALIVDAATCPASYTTVSGQASQYRTITTPQTWPFAEADCEDDGVGTHLAVIDSMTEDMAVDALTGASIWFGLTDRRVEGTVRWVTGALPTYTNYGTPGNAPAYDCSGIYQHRWVFGDCTTPIPYVCECDGVAAQSTAY